METKLQEGAKQILVQLEDGSTWKAEQRIDGLYLVEQLSDPNKSTAESEGAPEPGDMVEGTEPESEGEEGEPSPEEVEEVYEKMFRGGGKGASDYEKFFKELKDARGIPEEIKEKIKDPAFRARLSSIMLDNKYDRRLRGRTRGKLDMGRLPKVPMMARNVFMRKQSRKGKAYNVVLLVDESGSMSEDKGWAAAEATIFLLSQLDGLNINTAVIGFNQMIAVHKPWTGTSDYEAIYEAIGQQGHVEPYHEVSDSGYNCDYDAMHFAYEYFNKSPDEGENILIMLSDGAPAHRDDAVRVVDHKGKPIKGFKPHKLDYRLKREREHLNKLATSYKDVHSVGIGIFEGGWQIPEHFIIHSLDDLKPTIIKTLGKKIKRG